jgi:hypothetical protein
MITYRGYLEKDLIANKLIIPDALMKLIRDNLRNKMQIRDYISIKKPGIKVEDKFEYKEIELPKILFECNKIEEKRRKKLEPKTNER